MKFLSRSVNLISRNGDIVTKSSSDISKIMGEYGHYYAANPEMQKFLVMPYNLKIDGHKSASYDMDFISANTIGDLYVTQMISNSQIESALDQAFEFYFSGRSSTEKVNYELLIDQIVFKLEARAKKVSEQNFEFGKEMYYLLDRINDGFHKLYSTYDCKIKESHGDLHLSNMLWKDSRIHIIDPKGLSSLWMDSSYDLAKISHSIIGGYDFIINDREVINNTYAKDALVERILSTDVPYEIVRLNEASLFASMIPFHIERPDHVNKFLKNSRLILDELGV